MSENCNTPAQVLCSLLSSHVQHASGDQINTVTVPRSGRQHILTRVGDIRAHFSDNLMFLVPVSALIFNFILHPTEAFLQVNLVFPPSRYLFSSWSPCPSQVPCAPRTGNDFCVTGHPSCPQLSGDAPQIQLGQTLPLG